MPAPMTARSLRLPPRLFLYTMDQIADMLVVDKIDTYLHFDGRSTGTAPDDKMLARNIAPSGEKPEWRVDEKELIRWFKHTGFRPLVRLNWQR